VDADTFTRAESGPIGPPDGGDLQAATLSAPASGSAVVVLLRLGASVDGRAARWEARKGPSPIAYSGRLWAELSGSNSAVAVWVSYDRQGRPPQLPA
jgi:hypothetical protein